MQESGTQKSAIGGGGGKKSRPPPSTEAAESKNMQNKENILFCHAVAQVSFLLEVNVLGIVVFKLGNGKAHGAIVSFCQ